MSCNIVGSPFPDTTTLSVPFPPSCCEPDSGVTAFPGCNYLYDTLSICNGPSVAGGADYIACMCNQPLFNAYYDCESEYRLCLGSPEQDESLQDQISLWHSVCDTRTTSAITTPVISTILSGNSYQPNWCTSAESACASGTMENELCHSSNLGNPKGYQSCACQPQMLSLDYTCEYLNNKSCLLTTADLTNLGFYPFCSNLLDVLGGSDSNGTAPATQSATTTVDTASSFGSFTTGERSLTVSSLRPPPTSTPPKISTDSSSTSSSTRSSGSSTSQGPVHSTTQPALPGTSLGSLSVISTKSSGCHVVRLQGVVLYLISGAAALVVLIMSIW